MRRPDIVAANCARIGENERPGHKRKVPARRWGVQRRAAGHADLCQTAVFHRLYQTLPGDFIICACRIARLPRSARI